MASSSENKPPKTPVPIFGQTCETCWKPGHDYLSCDNRCIHCERLSHKRAVCLKNLAAYPRSAQDEQREQVVESQRNACLKLEAQVKLAETQLAMLQGVERMVNKGHYPGLKKPDKSTEAGESAQAEEVAMLDAGEEEESTTAVTGPCMSLFEGKNIGWRHIVPGYTKMTSKVQKRTRQTFNAMATGDEPLSRNAFLTDAMKRYEIPLSKIPVAKPAAKDKGVKPETPKDEQKADDAGAQASGTAAGREAVGETVVDAMDLSTGEDAPAS